MGSLGGSKSQKVKPTEQEKELAKIGREKYLDFEARFVPMENQLIAEIQGLGTPQEAERLRGAANVDVMRNRQPVAGVDPTSGRARGLELGSLADLTARDTAARNAAEIGGRKRYTGGLTNMVTLGRNLEGAALNNLESSAALETSRAMSESRGDYAAAQNQQSAIGSAAGLGVGLWYGRDRTPQQDAGQGVNTTRTGFDTRILP
jgi:hypothetical protein